MAETQYTISTGLTVIAECSRCGRGFISINRSTDPYSPQRGSRFFGQGGICGGQIVMLKPLPAPRETTGERD